jgi:hypothetical protein
MSSLFVMDFFRTRTRAAVRIVTSAEIEFIENEEYSQSNR